MDKQEVQAMKQGTLFYRQGERQIRFLVMIAMERP